MTGGEPVEEGGEEAASVTAEQEAALAAKRADDLMYAAKTGDVATIEALIAEGGATLTATRDDGSIARARRKAAILESRSLCGPAAAAAIVAAPGLPPGERGERGASSGRNGGETGCCCDRCAGQRFGDPRQET